MIALALALGLSSCKSRADQCSELAERFDSVQTVDQAIEIVHALDAEGCGEVAAQAKSMIALKLSEQFNLIPTSDTNSRAALAEQVLEFDPNHPGALLVRADAHFAAQRWTEAARDSDKAMGVLLGVPETETVKAELVRALQIYNDARSLANAYLVRDQHRGTQLCELARTRSAGVGAQILAEPVEFLTNSDEFTPKGKLAADALAMHLSNGCLNREAVLFGHTDPDGTAEHNCRLAERRLAAVQRHLGEYFSDRNKTLPHLTLVPQGEGQPRGQFPEGLTKAQTYQLLRRVEFRDTNAKHPPACDSSRENTVDYP